MATELPDSAENLRNSTTVGVSLIIPFLAGLDLMSPHGHDRTILIDPFMQTMVVIERSGSSPGLDSLLNELFSAKSGQPPASKASIDEMASVEISGDKNDDDRCVICLDEWEVGDKAKEMPCKHTFHGECIEKWLKIHGTCPVCRYEMPVDEQDSDDKKRTSDDAGSDIWVRFTLSTDR